MPWNHTSDPSWACLNHFWLRKRASVKYNCYPGRDKPTLMPAPYSFNASPRSDCAFWIKGLAQSLWTLCGSQYNSIVWNKSKGAVRMSFYSRFSLAVAKFLFQTLIGCRWVTVTVWDPDWPVNQIQIKYSQSATLWAAQIKVTCCLSLESFKQNYSLANSLRLSVWLHVLMQNCMTHESMISTWEGQVSCISFWILEPGTTTLLSKVQHELKVYGGSF